MRLTIRHPSIQRPAHELIRRVCTHEISLRTYCLQSPVFVHFGSELALVSKLSRVPVAAPPQLSVMLFLSSPIVRRLETSVLLSTTWRHVGRWEHPNACDPIPILAPECHVNHQHLSHPTRLHVDSTSNLPLRGHSHHLEFLGRSTSD